MKSPLCLFTPRLAFCLCTLPLFCLQANAGIPEPPSTTTPAQLEDNSSITIPGPLRSFLRMAGISQEVSPADVLPLLAHNVYYQGYEGPAGSDHPTEFLVLLLRYLQQAQELSRLAGPDGVIRVTGCDQASPLLHVLGYRIRGTCGQSDASVETENAERAFLTTDSGFPLPQLEKSLEGKQTFAYPFASSQVPVFFTASDWITKEDEQNEGFLYALLRHRSLARFYWAMAHMDIETRASLRQSPGLQKLIPFAAILDFYGQYICIRSGRVLVPGGRSAEPAWRDLVGVKPESAGAFTLHLLARDRGWLAALFDALARVDQSQQAHFTDPQRLRRDYEALRDEHRSEGAARPVFRPDPGLLLLLTRIRWQSNGEPYVPGNLAVWKEIFEHEIRPGIVGKWGKRAAQWSSPEQLLQAMFGLSRVGTETGPLQMYLAFSELDARRGPEDRLRPETVLLMAHKFPEFSNQYLIFSEFPSLDDSSITAFLNVAQNIDGLRNQTLRGNVLGTFQAEVGMWQIFSRQHQIPRERINSSWHNLMKSFDRIHSAPQLFDAGSAALKTLLVAADARPGSSQDEIIDVLAGPRQSDAEDQRIHRELANRMRSIMDEQRLVSLNTILALGEGLRQVPADKAASSTLLPLAGQLREFEMPRPIFSMSERSEWAAGIYNNHHTDLQMRTDLSKAITSPTPAGIEAARGQLAPFLRDTLVGLNYAYYEPPGGQILHDNPLFVRSHDFSGETVSGLEDSVWQAPQLFGQGAPAGGGAHFIGSLADLPYALAEAEQNFITPKNVQALIWEQMVPGLLASAVVPRWWGVSRNELHAVALYQEAGEELLTASIGNPDLRKKVIEILSDRQAPQREYRLQLALTNGPAATVLAQITPADSFYLTAEFRRKFPGEIDSWGTAGQELDTLSRRYPSEVGWPRLSRDFGVPHPLLEYSYARELLDVAPFPTFMGYSSRLLAESWDSNNLYWARLADELGYAPATLNQLVPELTRRMIEKIFATDQEDWPALLRATRETGEEFRQGKIAALTAVSGPPQH